MDIQRKISPYNYSTILNKQNLYIVIHYVGAVSTAKNNVDYYAREQLFASAHYFVDEVSIWQSVEDDNVAWHCGAKTYKHSKCRNQNSIGIEMCVKKDESGKWYFEEETVNNTISLVRNLMKKYNIPIENVIRHYDVTGKNCPAPYVDNPNEWEKFKSHLIIQELTTPNDIVWELGHRGIVEDTKGMLDEMTQNPNGRLYWLARKMLHYIRSKE